MGGLGQLRRRCEQMVQELALPTPLDPDILCQRLGERRGRPIRLLPMTLPVDSACGFLLGTDSADYVIYDRDTTRGHQIHIILHEVAHIVLDHGDPLGDALAGKTSQLTPHLDPALIRRLMGRTHYDAGHEREAEMLASLLHERMGQWTPDHHLDVPPEAAALAERLSHTLDHGGPPRD